MPKSASFDVLGTCFHFTPLITLIDRILHRTDPSTPIDATTLFHSWFYAAQRDFTYLHLSGSYTPIASVLHQTFRRACSIVNFPDPANTITDDDLAAIMTELKRLPPRDGLSEIFTGLRREGWDVYAVTNGAAQTSLKYFELAGIEFDSEHMLSCDEIQVAKPDVKVYENTNRRLDSRGCEAGDRWFVAAHSWDLIAARKAGFKTAWVASEEGDPCTGLFGEFDVVASDLRECFEMMRKA
ncbi:hypothetical protein LTR70_000103 [Exophiala xenobiotica]|uniref:Haloacid dehalogenase n=1 Tax=Lithohypha guttulata TaxID=1690604 RepID=A0ABR0KQ84_9EURO|nr:hypothetical protein LTR24_000228 [Lithohypha guttulata]KAK5330781.1 hypothetical protein LTR70_000103 [Exophiala xenobiotica]